MLNIWALDQIFKIFHLVATTGRAAALGFFGINGYAIDPRVALLNSAAWPDDKY